MCNKSQSLKILLIKAHLEGKKKETVTPDFSNAKHKAGDCSWEDGRTAWSTYGTL